MENYCKGGLKGYGKRREYQRLDGAARRRRDTKKAELGDGRRRRFFWRIRITPRLRVLRSLVASPKRILTRIRDAYVRLMSGVLSGSGVREDVGLERPPVTEYDEKMLVEIYKSMVAQAHPFAAVHGG